MPIKQSKQRDSKISTGEEPIKNKAVNESSVEFCREIDASIKEKGYYVLPSGTVITGTVKDD